ncbi:MAG: HAD-IA family hydrolase [Candidatus Saccharimonadales bacterium]
MIRAVIFDCFGVLTTDGWLPFKRKYFSDNAKLEAEATDLNKQVDAGLASYEEFISSIAQLAQVPRREAHKAIEDNVADEELFEYIARDLKPNYKLGLLSNAGANWLDKLFTEAQVKLFDAVSLSYQTGFVKPDLRAYQMIADQLGVDPQECIFIDDQERYCSAAREVGMQALVYTSFKQLQADLSPLLQEA